MGKARQRNHYNPRFLLNRFASKVDRAKHWIWRIGRGGSVRELSTRDVEVSRRFYGEDSAGVEDALEEAEGHFSAILARIDGGRPPEAFSEELRQLVWTMAVRTRAIREQFATATDGLLSEFAGHSTSADARDELARWLHSSFEEQMKKAVPRLPLEQRRTALDFVRVPAVREQLMQLVPSSFGAWAGAMVRMVQDGGIIPTSIKTGQVRGLAKLLDRGTPPDGFAPGGWHVISANRHSFVLGDGAVFAKMEDGSLGSLLKSIQNWSEAYLPISDRQVLVATKKRDRPTLDHAVSINQISAAFALEYIYASCAGSATRDLISLIGTRGPLFARHELAEMVRQSFTGRGS
jgi:hypothetical protein